MKRVALSGFLAAKDDPALALRDAGLAGVAQSRHGEVTLVRWGLEALADDPVLALSHVQRTAADGAVPDDEIVRAVHADPSGLVARMLPPYAIAHGDESGVTMLADWAGFRQLYHGDQVPVMSTSASLAARQAGAALDRGAVAVQALLGWQLGQRTLFEGVSKLRPGAIGRIDAHGVSVEQPPTADEPELPMADAVRQAADVLRRAMEKLLDEHPDAILQLSGGHDSRVLLCAVPPSRRKGLRAVTLGSDGDDDVRTARVLAASCGLDHEVRAIGDVSTLSPEDAWSRVLDAAARLEGQSDPLALASLALAEEKIDQGVRISGVGGEVARGFFYFGRVRDRAFGPHDARRLASWGMFANHAVEKEMLRAEFASWGREFADQAVYQALRDGGSEWFRATDNLYLRHRVQRWAGTNDTGVWDRRVVINPMLDQDFLRIVARVAPRHKAHSRFFALVEATLDPGLARIPLDGRPAPIAYASASLPYKLQRLGLTGRKLVKKTNQRWRSGNKSLSGAEGLARLVTAQWRNEPSILESAHDLAETIRSDWTQRLLDGEIMPRPSSAALVSNLVFTSSSTRGA